MAGFLFNSSWTVLSTSMNSTEFIASFHAKFMMCFGQRFRQHHAYSALLICIPLICKECPRGKSRKRLEIKMSDWWERGFFQWGYFEKQLCIRVSKGITTVSEEEQTPVSHALVLPFLPKVASFIHYSLDIKGCSWFMCRAFSKGVFTPTVRFIWSGPGGGGKYTLLHFRSGLIYFHTDFLQTNQEE